MKKIRQCLVALSFVMFCLISQKTFATTIPVTPIQSVVEDQTNEVTETTDVAVTAVKDDTNYVRITQPNIKDDIQTFDSQMNIMGEASVGTEIQMIVYYGEGVSLSEMENSEYKIKVVGFTETFNQLIDLREGQNNILIRYQYADSNAIGTLSVRIIRRPAAEKEMIKSTINPQAIAEKIVSPLLTSIK